MLPRPLLLNPSNRLTQPHAAGQALLLCSTQEINPAYLSQVGANRIFDSLTVIGARVDWILGIDEMGRNRSLSELLMRLVDRAGQDRLDYLDDLPEDELRELIDQHELSRARRKRRPKPPEKPEEPDS